MIGRQIKCWLSLSIILLGLNICFMLRLTINNYDYIIYQILTRKCFKMKNAIKPLYNISNEWQSSELIIIEHNNTGARLPEKKYFKTFGFPRKRNSQKFSACVSDYKRPPGTIALIMPTKLAHRLAPSLETLHL